MLSTPVSPAGDRCAMRAHVVFFEGEASDVLVANGRIYIGKDVRETAPEVLASRARAVKLLPLLEGAGPAVTSAAPAVPDQAATARKQAIEDMVKVITDIFAVLPDVTMPHATILLTRCYMGLCSSGETLQYAQNRT